MRVIVDKFHLDNGGIYIQRAAVSMHVIELWAGRDLQVRIAQRQVRLIKRPWELLTPGLGLHKIACQKSGT